MSDRARDSAMGYRQSAMGYGQVAIGLKSGQSTIRNPMRSMRLLILFQPVGVAGIPHTFEFDFHRIISWSRA